MPPEWTAETFVRLAVAALGGLAVGIERELSARASGGSPRFAGVRTFLLLSLSGGLAATLHQIGVSVGGWLVAAAASALVVAAYVVKAARGDPDATTEVAAIVSVAGGALAGLGYLPAASGVFALTWLVLIEKVRIHSLVYRIEPRVLEAAARFAVLALVVLPLLPAEAYGPPPGLRPRELWVFVLLFSGVGFVGFIALKALGPDKGYGMAGLLGGLVSSTAVTLGFSRESRSSPSPGRALALGVVAACTVVYVRVFVLALVLNPALGLRSVKLFAPPFAIGLIACLVLLRGRQEGSVVEGARNPLRLGPAVQMAVLFQAFLYLVEWARGRFGDSGVLVSAAVFGLTDMDALTYSMGKSASQTAELELGSMALAIGLLSNTLVKLAMSALVGRGAFRGVAAAGLAAIAVAGGAALIVL